MNQSNHTNHIREMLSKDGQYGDQWHGVYTKPKQELKAVGNLEEQDFLVYCPMATTDERTEMHRKVKPLFARYLFIFLRSGIDDFSKVRSTPGVSYMLKFGDQPGIISQDEIEKYKRLEKKNGIIDIGLEYKKGDEVYIKTGAYTDRVGVIDERKSRNRLIIAIDILGRKSLVEFEARAIEPVEE